MSERVPTKPPVPPLASPTPAVDETHAVGENAAAPYCQLRATSSALHRCAVSLEHVVWHRVLAATHPPRLPFRADAVPQTTLPRSVPGKRTLELVTRSSSIRPLR